MNVDVIHLHAFIFILLVFSNISSCSKQMLLFLFFFLVTKERFNLETSWGEGGH
jgi:hypothetical protein